MNEITKNRDSRKRIMGFTASLLACFALVMALIPVQAIADDTSGGGTPDSPVVTPGDGQNDGVDGDDSVDPADPVVLKNVIAPQETATYPYNENAWELVAKNEGYSILVTPNKGVDMSKDNAVFATDAGTYTLTLSLKDGYQWRGGGREDIVRTVTITPMEIKRAAITHSKNVTMTEGLEAAKADINIVSPAGRKLVEGVDYRVEYIDNDNYGTATINIEGMGNYQGKTARQFEIVEPVKIYRLYCPVNMEHLYTLDENEYKYLKEHGWNDEQVGWIAPKESAIPVYRLYNEGTRQHLYTTDENERKILSKERGWRDEGVKFYSEENATVPVQRLYNEALKIHLSTTDQNEVNVNQSRGWKLDATSFFAAKAGK